MELEREAQRHTRRSMLTGALRGAALGVLAGVGSFAVAKRRRLKAEGKCISDGVCSNCAVLTQCGLPAALRAKESVQRGDYGRAK